MYCICKGNFCFLCDCKLIEAVNNIDILKFRIILIIFKTMIHLKVLVEYGKIIDGKILQMKKILNKN